MSCAGAHQRDGMDADDRGLTMECVCIACDGSGLAEHVDRTLPPPPCRLCHPNEAAVHMALARETRTVATARRRDAFQMLRAAIMRGDSLPRQRHSPSDGHVESSCPALRRTVAFGGPGSQPRAVGGERRTRGAGGRAVVAPSRQASSPDRCSEPGVPASSGTEEKVRTAMLDHTARRRGSDGRGAGSG
jgi:hypothetical protein